MVDTTDEWIISRTGIENRHIVDDGEATSDMATQIAKQLLEKSGKSPQDIDLILVATSTPDFPVISTAALVQDKIGAKIKFVMPICKAPTPAAKLESTTTNPAWTVALLSFSTSS